MLYLILIIIIILFILKQYKVEPYNTIPSYSYDDNTQWNPGWFGKRNNDCYKLDKRNCMKYSNCGLCVKDGHSTCVPGDIQGPFYTDRCSSWIYTDYYDRHIFGEKVVTETPSWNVLYPEYEQLRSTPKSIATLGN